jgi:uncharacterized membrane protein
MFFTFALLCFFLFRYGTRIIERYWSLEHLEKSSYGTWRSSIQGITYAYVLAWTLILVSLLLGMFLRDSAVDSKAYPLLGIGVVIFLVAPVLVSILGGLISVLCMLAWGLLHLGARAQKETDQSES